MMVNVAIPESIIEQSGTSSSGSGGNGQCHAADKTGVQVAPEEADGMQCGTGSGSEEAKKKKLGLCQVKVPEGSTFWGNP